MKPPETIRGRLDQPSGTANLLLTGWDAFELIQQVAFAQAKQDPGAYATWMSVIPPACEGRDALGEAPSLSHCPSHELAPGAVDIGSGDEVAADLAALAAHLASRLRIMAEEVAGTGDRRALDRAAAAAEEVRGLLATGG